MPADLLDTDWPSPSPELEVRARVRARTRTLRRQRSLPAMGAVALVLFALIARPAPDSPVRVATDGDSPPPAEEPAPAPDEESTPTTTTPASTTTTAKSSDPKREPGVLSVGEEGPAVSVPDPEPRKFPSSPAYSAFHPLLVDPQGDGWVTTGPSNSESDPTIDITWMDVTSDATSVTTELRLLDLRRAPLSAFPTGSPGQQRYQMTLKREKGHFSFYLARNVADGTFTVVGTFWQPGVGNADNAAMTGYDVADVRGSVNVHSGTVRVTAAFDEMNRAMVAAGSANAPVGAGTTVVPLGYAQTLSENRTSTGSGDAVQSSDPDFAYRLGD